MSEPRNALSYKVYFDRFMHGHFGLLYSCMWFIVMMFAIHY